MDFGCGNGKAVLRCLYRGAQKIYGIDLSSRAIDIATKVVANSGLQDKAEFYCGGTYKLEEFDNDSLDGAIIYNVVDNLTTEDGKTLLGEIHIT